MNTFIVAELGINHNGDMDVARQMILRAHAAGADAAKVQNYRAVECAPDKARMWTWTRADGQKVAEPLQDLLARYELKPGALAELTQYAGHAGIELFSTPSSLDGIKECVDCGHKRIKIGSSDIRYLDLISTASDTGLPCIISTGGAAYDEIVAAYEVFNAPDRLTLCVCTSDYPTALENCHVRRVAALQGLHYDWENCKSFDSAVGYSSHYPYWLDAFVAVSLGATYIEKHVTMDILGDGPDHIWSADLSSLGRAVREIRNIELALGSPDLVPRETAVNATNP